MVNYIQNVFIINFNAAAYLDVNLDGNSMTVILAAIRTCELDDGVALYKQRCLTSSTSAK